jgi:hypothetical protein
VFGQSPNIFPLQFILHDLLPDSVILIVIINFIAICALSGLLDFTSTQVALRVGGFAESEVCLLNMLII